MDPASSDEKQRICVLLHYIEKYSRGVNDLNMIRADRMLAMN